MDFTLRKYKQLLQAFAGSGYRIVTVRDYLETSPDGKVLILRHDVDEQPQNALKMAELESGMGINATYYFRRVPKSDHPDVIRSIAAMGHEIGYHYEDLSKTEGDLEKAIASFSDNLDYFRQYYPVKTVCMHGSSSSEFDNREIWKRVSLKEFDLVGEPYLSFDFNSVYYLTDTGYAWDGGKYAVRDKVSQASSLSFHTTDQVIEAVNKGDFPSQSMILAHTLWTDDRLLWTYLHFREYFRNRVKLLTRKSRVLSALYAKLVKLYWK